MADLESQIRLALELTGSKTAGEAADEIERLGKEAGKTNEEIEKATRVFRYYEEILRGATSAEDDAVRAAVDMTDASKEQALSLNAVVQALDTTRTSANDLVGDEEAVGFKGLAGNALKAEKAMAALAGGTGLARVGPMLESVTKALGGPEGLGLALGGLAFGVGVLLPKLAALWTAFEDGPKSVRDAEEAIRRFDESVKAHDDHLLKRSLAKVDKEIQDLEVEQEQKRDVGQKLPPEDAARLKELRRRSVEGHEELEVGKELASVGPTKRKRTIAQAVHEAMAESGGVEALIGDNPDIVAKRIVANALKGDEQSLATLKRWSPEFAAEYDKISPETKERDKVSEQLTEKGRHTEAKTWAEKDAQDKRDETKKATEKRKTNAEIEANIRAGEQIGESADRAKRQADAKATREAKAAQTKAEHAATKSARENTPVALNRAAVQQQENDDLGMVQQYAPNLAPELQKSAAKHARANHQAGFDLSATIQQALDYAIEQARQDFARGIEAGLRHSQGHQATQFGRG